MHLGLLCVEKYHLSVFWQEIGACRKFVGFEAAADPMACFSRKAKSIVITLCAHKLVD